MNSIFSRVLLQNSCETAIAIAMIAACAPSQKGQSMFVGKNRSAASQPASKDPGAETLANKAAEPGADDSANSSKEGESPNSVPATSTTEAPTTLTNCPFTVLVNFGVFVAPGVFTGERRLQFPADASGFQVLITSVAVNDNTPLVAVNGNVAAMPPELNDLRSHVLPLASDISAFLKGGTNQLVGSALNRYGDEGGLQISLAGSYKTSQGCSGPTVN